MIRQAAPRKMHITIAQGLVVWGGGFTNQETTLVLACLLFPSVRASAIGVELLVGGVASTPYLEALLT